MISSLEIEHKENEVKMLELELDGRRLKELLNKEDTTTINEECIGCCKVVDVAAKLQKELDACQLVVKRFKILETQETDKLHKIIDEKDVVIDRLIHEAESTKKLKDQNIEDLKELYDFHEGELEWFKDVISARDLTIESLTTMCQSSGTERSKQNQALLHIKAELDAAKQFNPFDLVLMSGSMENISDIVDDHFTSCPTTDEWDGGVIELRSWIGRLSSTVETLEAELSARKHDSEVLKKVVEVIEDESVDNNKAANLIADIVGYYDAPEGPPETPIDEPQEITVTFAFLELP